MKRPKLWFALVLVALAMVVAVNEVHRYKVRPFFGRDFSPFLGWELCRPLGLDNNTCVYFDRRERVLLVVPEKTTRDHRRQVQWVIERAPVSDRLRLHETEDETIKEIEWRRDCVIFVDSDGMPIYVSVSVREFRDAFSTPGIGAIRDIVRRARAGQTTQPSVNSEAPGAIGSPSEKEGEAVGRPF